MERIVPEKVLRPNSSCQSRQYCGTTDPEAEAQDDGSPPPRFTSAAQASRTSRRHCPAALVGRRTTCGRTPYHTWFRGKPPMICPQDHTWFNYKPPMVSAATTLGLRPPRPPPLRSPPSPPTSVASPTTTRRPFRSGASFHVQQFLLSRSNRHANLDVNLDVRSHPPPPTTRAVTANKAPPTTAKRYTAPSPADSRSRT